MNDGGKFYNALEAIDELKKHLEEKGYRLWHRGKQILITGSVMPPYGEILDNRIITLVKYESEENIKRKDELKKLEKILSGFPS